jgi:PAS domain S-box-containing protein
LAEAQRVAKLGNWKLNLDDKSVKWSQELYRIFDVGKDDFGMVYESFLARVHIDDRKRVLHTNSKARKSGEPFELEYRIVTRSGEVKHIREVGYAMKDTHGGVVGLFGTAQDITEYTRAQRELQQLSGRLLQSQDEERRRIARELHDTTGQNLVALATMLGQLRAPPPQTDRKSRKRISECKALAERCIREIRTLSYVLHPPVLEQSGLREAIRDYVKGFTERSGIEVVLDVSGRLGRMQLDVELTLFRVVQESLTNIQRHSGSKHAKIRINLNSDLTLEVSDPGRESHEGLSKPKPVPHFKSGVGLLSMQERVKSIGGRLQVEITKHGSIVRAMIPLGAKRDQTSHSAG